MAEGAPDASKGLRGLIPSDEVTRHLVNLPLCTEAGYIRIRLGLGLGWARVGLERIRNGPSVGGSFAATWAHRNAGSERNVLDGRKGRAAKNSVLTRPWTYGSWTRTYREHPFRKEVHATTLLGPSSSDLRDCYLSQSVDWSCRNPLT